MTTKMTKNREMLDIFLETLTKYWTKVSSEASEISSIRSKSTASKYKLLTKLSL